MIKQKYLKISNPNCEYNRGANSHNFELRCVPRPGAASAGRKGRSELHIPSQPYLKLMQTQNTHFWVVRQTKRVDGFPNISVNKFCRDMRFVAMDS